MNCLSAGVGGVPMCHGAGGVAEARASSARAQAARW
jgi:hypothetical protein